MIICQNYRCNIPTNGTPNVKFDMEKVRMRLPYSAEITKQAEVAIGPIKNNNPKR